MEDIKQLENKIQKARVKQEIINKQLKNDFLSLIKKVFENKNIKAIYWTQYTPYFNDGEACVFRVNDLCCIVNSEFVKIEDRYVNFIGNSAKNKRSTVFFYHIETIDGDMELEVRNYSQISELTNIMDFAKEESNMESIFLMARLSELMTSDYFEKVLLDTIGDHMKVTITNSENGIEIDMESYSHD